MIITKTDTSVIDVQITRQVQNFVNKMLEKKTYYVNKGCYFSAYLHFKKPRLFPQILEPDLKKFEEKVQYYAEEYVLSKYEKINMKECR